MDERRFPCWAFGFAALTGAAGLIYQIAWQRYLSRLLGSDSLATATVLGVFLGGLSLGFLLWGRLSGRSANLFRVYGALEGAIGIWALGFPWLFAAVDGLTSSWRFEPRLGWLLEGALCAVVLIGVPTVCMGATVPMLTRALATSIERATRTHALVYAFNTAGAVAGTLVAGFVAIRWLGLPGTVRAAGLLNLAAAVFFTWSRGRAGSALGGRRARRRPGASHPHPSWVLHAVAFVGGFAFMTLESNVIRVVGLTLGSSTYSLSLVVAAFLACIATGAWIVGRRRSLSPTTLLVNQVVACAALLPVFLTLDDWPYVAHLLRIQLGHGIGDFIAYQALVFGALCLALALPVGCMGATLPLAFDALKGSLGDVGRSAGSLFAWNALGNLLGGLLGGFLVYRLLSLGEVFLLAAGLTAGTALLASVRLGWRSRAAAAAAGIATLALAWTLPSHDPLRFAVGTFHLQAALEYSSEGPQGFYRGFHRGRSVVAYADDPEATVAVVENPRFADALRQRFPSLGRSLVAVPSALGVGEAAPRSILINGKADSSTFYDRETLRLLAHLPALAAARRERLLIVGLGTGVTVGELALYPGVASLEVVEILPGVARMLPHFGEWTHAVHEDPRLRLRIGDALRILRRSDRRWDLIVSQPSNPWMSGGDQLFSREFYRLVREHLEPGGVFASWVQRYSTNETITARTLNALRSEFPHVRAFRSGSDDLLLASTRPVELSRAALTLANNARVARSLAEIRIESPGDLLRLEAEPLGGFDATEHAGVETLDHPRVHFLAGLAFFRGDDPEMERRLRRRAP